MKQKVGSEFIQKINGMVHNIKPSFTEKAMTVRKSRVYTNQNHNICMQEKLQCNFFNSFLPISVEFSGF